MGRRSPWGWLATLAADRPLVLVAGQECRLIGCTPNSGRAKVLYQGRHYRVPAAAVQLLTEVPRP